MNIPINKEKYLDKFIVVPQTTLFEPTWEAVKQLRCPYCNCRLSLNREGTVYRCKSVKHKKKFAIKVENLTT